MIPYLKDGNWDAGMVAGVRAVCVRLDGSMTNDSDENSGESPIGLILAVIGFFAIAIVAGILKTRAASKCPQCGQHKLQRSNSVLVSRRNGVRTEDVTYTCRNCGHKVVRRQQSYDENYRGGGGGGPVISAEAALAEVAEALAEVASEEVWAVAEEPARGSDPSFS